ncbi:MAG: hypothetical protein ACE5KE_15590, partial [Methanosarcinales archaeon]
MSEIKTFETKSLKICYVAPDIPVPHTGDFIGGSTHVMKIAENFAKKGNKVFIISRRTSKTQKYSEKISDNILVYRIYRGLVFPIRGGISKKSKESNNKLISNLFTLLE